MCLDLNRRITFGETWNVNIVSVPLDASQSSIDYRADAWIFFLALGIVLNISAYSLGDVV